MFYNIELLFVDTCYNLKTKGINESRKLQSQIPRKRQAAGSLLLARLFTCNISHIFSFGKEVDCHFRK